MLVQLKVLIFYLFIFRIAFGYGIPLMEAIGAVPAIKNSNVETIMTGARTATITDPSTTVFTEGAHHFTTCGLYDLEAFLAFISHLLNIHYHIPSIPNQNLRICLVS